MVKLPSCELTESLLKENPPLHSSLELIRSSAKSLLENLQHLHFTKHDISHSDRIVEKLNSLSLMLYTPLNLHEIYILLAAAYLHDIGMQSRDYNDLVKIREEHHMLSYKMILDSLKDPQKYYNLKIESTYCKSVALIAKAHRKTDLNHEDYLDFDIEYNKTIRMKLLGAMLRLGDELDIESTRIEFEKLKVLTDIDDASKLHWYKHNYVMGSSIKNNKLKLTFRIPPKYEATDIFEKLKNMVQGNIVKEYDLFKDGIFWDEGIRLTITEPSVIKDPIVKEMPENVIDILLQRTYISSALNDWANIVKICFNQVDITIQNFLNHVYNKEFYIERGIKSTFNNFLEDNSSSLFVLSGQAGVGKTSTICSLAERWSGSLIYIAKDKFPQLVEIEKFIRDCFEIDPSIEISDLMKTLSNSAQQASKHLLLFIDTDLYVEKFNQEYQPVIELLEKFRGMRLKVIVTLRDHSIVTPLDRDIKKYSFKNVFGSLINTGISDFLNNFDDSEVDEAIKVYSKEFKYEVIGGFSETAYDRIKYPHLLRLFSEANENKIVQGPINDIRYVELGAKYWQNVYDKIETRGNKISYSEFESKFLMIMKEIRDNGLSYFPIESFEYLVGKDIISVLFDEGVFTKDNKKKQNDMKFIICFLEFQEYLMALQVIEEYDLYKIDKENEDTIAKFFADVYQMMYDFNYGLVQFTLLLLEQNNNKNAVYKLLTKIIEKNDSTWNIIGCQVISKLVTINEDVLKVIKQFAKHSDIKVRINIAETIGKITKKIPEDSVKIIFDLFQSKDESLRVELVKAFFRIEEKYILQNLDRFREILQTEPRNLIRATAAESLSQVKLSDNKFLLPLIDDLMQIKSSSILIELSNSIGLLGKDMIEEAVDILLNILGNLSGREKEYPIAALASLAQYDKLQLIEVFQKIAKTRNDDQKICVSRYINYVDKEIAHQVWEKYTDQKESYYVRTEVSQHLIELNVIDEEEREQIVSGIKPYKKINHFLMVKKLDGSNEKFVYDKLWRSIYYAAKKIGGKDESLAKKLGLSVIKELQIKYPHKSDLNTSDINEMVNTILESNGHYKTLNSYLTHRREKYNLSQQHTFIKVKKRSGNLESFNEDKIIASIYDAAREIGGKDLTLAKKLSAEVIDELNDEYFGKSVLETNLIHNSIVKVLRSNGYDGTSDSYTKGQKE